MGREALILGLVGHVQFLISFQQDRSIKETREQSYNPEEFDWEDQDFIKTEEGWTVALKFTLYMLTIIRYIPNQK